MDPFEYLSPHYKFYYPDMVMKWGNDCLVSDQYDNPYIDATSGWGALAFGHCNKDIHEAVVQQLEKLVHTCGCNFNHYPQNILAKLLHARMPQTDTWKLFFTNSGAESIEGAMKLARYVTKGKKPGFIAFQGGFHGRTYGAMSLGSAFPKLREGFEPLLSGVEIFPYNDPQYLKENIRKDMAAVFVEPVQGVGGCKVASKEFMQAIRDFCFHTGSLMVVDEVQSGVGRTGKFWAFEHSGVVPDIICSAKALGGGFPLGAVISKKYYMNWPAGVHGSTFGGHPVACMAGSVVVKKVTESFLKKVAKNSALLRAGLEKLFGSHRVSGLGFMLAVDIVDAAKRDELMQKCKKNGLLVLPAEPAAIRLLPPLNCPVFVLKQILIILKNSL